MLFTTYYLLFTADYLYINSLLAGKSSVLAAALGEVQGKPSPEPPSNTLDGVEGVEAKVVSAPGPLTIRRSLVEAETPVAGVLLRRRLKLRVTRHP